MEKNKEDEMTDLEIIKKNFNIITEVENYDYWDELEEEALDAATRMVAEIERLKTALAEKQDIVRCGECKHKSYCESLVWFYGDMGNSDYRLIFCSVGTRKEAKDED